MDRRKPLAIGGAMVLTAGAFSPVVHRMIGGSSSFMHESQPAGIALLVLAVAAVGLGLLELFRALWLPSLGALGAVVWVFVATRRAIAQTAASITEHLPDAIASRLADVPGRVVQMQWGWAVLLCGVVLIAVAAAVGSGQRASHAER